METAVTMADAIFIYMTIGALIAARVDVRVVAPHGGHVAVIGILAGFVAVCIGWLPVIMWRILR